MKKIRQINKPNEFKFSYKDLIQRSSVNTAPGLVLFLGGLLAKTAWAVHQEANLAASSAVNAHKLPLTHGLAEVNQDTDGKEPTAVQSHPDASTAALVLPQPTADSASIVDTKVEDAADSVNAPEEWQFAALDTVPKDGVPAKSELPAVQLTVDLSDLNLGTVHQLPTIAVPLPEYVAPTPATMALEEPESYLKWLGLFAAGGTAGMWTDFAAGVVSSSTSSSYGGYAIDGALYNSVVYRYDSAQSASNYTDIFGDGSVYDYVWGGSAGLRYTTSAGAYLTLPTSGGSGGAIKVMASTSSYDMGWDSSLTYGFNTPLIMSSPYDTGTGQVVNPFTTLIQGLIDNDATLSVATAASRVSTAFGLSSYYSSLGISSDTALLYFNPLDYTSSTNATTKAYAIAMQAKAIEIVATISGGTQAVLAQNSNMDEVSVTKAILSSLVSYVGTNYAAGVDLSSSTVINSLMSSVTASSSSGSSETVYLTDQALSTIATVNDNVYLTSSTTTLAEAYAVQLQLMKNTNYSDTAFQAMSNVVSYAASGDTILSMSFSSTSVGKSVNSIMTSLVADPTIKINLSGFSTYSLQSDDTLKVSTTYNSHSYEYSFTSTEISAGLSAGYLSFNLSDLTYSGTALTVSELDTLVVKARFKTDSASSVDGAGFLAFMENTNGATLGLITETNGYGLTTTGQLTSTPSAASTLTGTYGKLVTTATGAWTYTSTDARNSLTAGEVDTTETFSVLTSSGSYETVTITYLGTNDIAVISGTSTGTATEDSSTTVSGTLTVVDADSSQAVLIAQTDVAGDKGYGTFTVSAAGAWTYTLSTTNTTIQALAAGSTTTDTLTVYAADGTDSQKITVTITGVNDVPTISGTSTGSVTEDSTTIASSTLSIVDADTGESSFATPSTSSLSGTYGAFTFSSGAWTYTVDSTKAAVQALGAGSTATDTLTVYSYDGTASQTITATVTGVNDLAVISGTSTGTATEDSTATVSDTLSVTDVDTGEAILIAQTDVAGDNGYGTFTVSAAGAWTYTLSSTNTTIQALAAGSTTTDTLTVSSADGTDTQQITVTITGVNDAASFSGDTTGSVTQDGVTTASGTLSVADVDTGEAVFASTSSLVGDYGTFTFDTSTGQWGYTLTSLALGSGADNSTATDSLTVYSSDGSSQVITVDLTGANDSATISGSYSASVTEGATTTASGTLAVTDVDTGEAVFATPSSLVGNYGTFTFDASTGEWGYTLTSEALGAGSTATETLTVYSYDGTASQDISVALTGVNDVPTISGTSTGSVTEDSAVTASGTLTITDADTGESSFATLSASSLSGAYGAFTFSSGAWTYTVDSTKSAVQALASGSTATDTLTVYSYDGTASKTITATVTGVNDVPTISGTNTGSVTEDSSTVASGTLTVTDTDTNESVFASPATASLSGTYGAFTFNATSGAWTYTVDNTKSAVQALALGSTATDTLTVYSYDGTASKTITATVTGVNDVPTFSSSSNASTYYIYQGSYGSTLTTVYATDVDTGDSVTAYGMSYQSNDATSGYFTVDNSSSGAITFNLAGAISAAVDATDSNSDGLADSPFTIHVTATDSYSGVSSPYAITVNVYMAVSSSTDTSASLPYTSSNWSFAPHTTTSGGETVSDGFNLTNTTYSSIYLSLSDTVTTVSFTGASSGDSGTLSLSNDGSTGTITDTSSTGNSIKITSGTVENTLIKVLADSTHTITGTTDSEADTGLGALTNYRDDTLQITDAAFSASTFSMSGDNLLITMATGGVKTVTEVEAVKFSDGTTVRVVGADGYASFLEAMTQTNTSHANNGDYIYGASASGYAPTSTQLDTSESTYLVQIGTSDFYVYHG